MKKFHAAALAAATFAFSSSAAGAQAAGAAQADEAAKLAEAHAIINVMFPPATRSQMMNKMMTDITAPMRKSLPMDGITDPGLRAIFTDYMDTVLAAERPVIVRHLPAMTDAMALAYTHQFSLAELKNIHAFAQTPSGRDYFSHAMTVISDPAVQKVNADIIADSQQAAKATIGGLKEKVTAYVKTHPDAAAQLQALGQAK